MRCLVVDVGNTSVAAAVARQGRIGRVHRLATKNGKLSGIRTFVKEVAGGRPMDGSVLCSVVPAVTDRWRAALQAACGTPPVVVTNQTRLGLRIDYPRPQTIGPDRLANACGAVARHGAPVIVADFGTALTFDVVSAQQAYIGGVIAPGLSMMTDYLAERTALLPHARLRGAFGRVGKSTVGAMRIGAKIGYRGMVREIVHYLTLSLGFEDPALCATGGFAEWALDGLDLPFHFEPDLTLYGLSRVFEMAAE